MTGRWCGISVSSSLLEGYDEPEILPSSSRQICLTGADFGQDVTQVQIVTLDGTDIGWSQSIAEDDALFLGQLFVDESLRRRGIGTQLVTGLIKEAGRVGQAVTLAVVKTNPARRLYQRLGFRTTHEDERKFYMRRDWQVPGS